MIKDVQCTLLVSKLFVCVFCLLNFVYIYLAVPRLNCGMPDLDSCDMWDLAPLHLGARNISH